MGKQLANTVLMIRPVSFRANDQTYDNHFQVTSSQESASEINTKATQEFNGFVEKLRDVGIKVLDFDDTVTPDTPDSIFPNNWVSFHEDGTTILYPMFAENRRHERRQDILDSLQSNFHLKINSIIDYTDYENKNIILEGTGSLVLDRYNKKAYCSLSHRAQKDLVLKFCDDNSYTPIVFESFQTVDGEKKMIYHTNVLMSVAESFAVVCIETIKAEDRKHVIDSLTEDGKEIIEINESQLNNFAGNVLALENQDGKPYLVMSNSAFNAFTSAQKEQIEKHCSIISVDIGTIEKYGGGSARCMMCEVFLPSQ